MKSGSHGIDDGRAGRPPGRGASGLRQLRRLGCLMGIVCLSLAGGCRERGFDRDLQPAKAGDAEAQFRLGVHYANGQGAPKDAARAYQWLNLCARPGFRPSDANAMMAEEGKSQALKRAVQGTQPLIFEPDVRTDIQLAT